MIQLDFGSEEAADVALMGGFWLFAGLGMQGYCFWVLAVGGSGMKGCGI